jgi:hypothetical protein
MLVLWPQTTTDLLITTDFMIAPSLQIRDMGALNPFHTVAAGKKVCIVAKIPHFLAVPNSGGRKSGCGAPASHERNAPRQGEISGSACSWKMGK